MELCGRREAVLIVKILLPPQSPFLPLVGQREMLSVSPDARQPKPRENHLSGHPYPGFMVPPSLRGGYGISELLLVSRLLEEFLGGMDPHQRHSLLNEPKTLCCPGHVGGRVLTKWSELFP